MTDKSKWECFSDAAYFDKWAVRNTSDMSFSSVIHVNTKEEAEFLVEKLNSYKELVGALESAYILLSANDKKMEEIFGGIYREQKAKIGKALKKAKGE